MKTRSISLRGRNQRLAAYSAAFMLSLCLVPVAMHAQTLTTLADFNGTNGALPVTQLTVSQLTKAKLHRPVQHSNGNFYGTTPQGGANSAGTVYQLTPAGVVTTLYSFCSVGGSACTDGQSPLASLAVGSDGNLYGTTFLGGANNGGTVFKITTTGALTTLYSFCSKASCADGSNPQGALVQASNGDFYGTTYTGGGSNDGTVFEITAGGSLTTLHSFSGSDGINPEGDLLNSGGNFYGATFSGGGSNNGGTVFEISPSGSLTTLYAFCTGSSSCNDGENPLVPLVSDAFGDVYGTTANAGANNGGTLFVISPFLGFHTLYHFCSKTNCTDGSNPVAGPLIGTDGNLYGTTLAGGNSNGDGTIYQVTPWGVQSTLYEFCSQTNCTDGATPEGAMIQASNGYFYGTTAFGGTSNLGPAFSLTPPTPTSANGCNGSYYANYLGNIFVSNGQTCEFTDGAVIFGNVYVTGGSLILNNASVLGNVEIDGGTYALGPSLTIYSNLQIENNPSSSAQNTICGATVRGDLQFHNNAAPVEIGSTAGACPGNSIGGNLQVISNTALVQIFDNTISNNLQCQSNSSITGGGNTAKSKTGQCSSF
jgi:uncharacterized repeat protein (TIGR03803 family)